MPARPTSTTTSTATSAVRSRPRLVLAAVAALAMALSLGVVGGDAAAQGDVIVLDGATSAEGIASGAGSAFFAGDLNAGDVYRGDYATGETELLVDAPDDGRAAVGMSVDVDESTLFVAGGPSGNAYAYDTDTGEEIGVAAVGEGFVNDAIAVDGGAWFTNSNAPEVTFVPVTDSGLGEPDALTLTGPAAATDGEFNLNGIEAVDADTLIVAHSALRGVYTVDTETGATAEIALDRTVDDGGLTGADGILLDGDTLYVVENQANRVTAYDLADDLSSATLQRIITDDAYTVPTTAALAPGGRLATVNAQFGVTDDTTYEVVVVDPESFEDVGPVTGDRLAGPTRIETALAVSEDQFPEGATTAYLARSDEFADALAAGTVTDGPILLVPSCGDLPTAVADELVRLDVDEVVALGGVNAICDDVLDAAVAAAQG